MIPLFYMSKKPESRLQQSIHKHLEKEFNAKFFKVHGGPFMPVGLGDLVGCIGSLFFMLEIKRPAKDSKPTKIQLKVLEEYRSTGACACVITSKKMAEDVVTYFLKHRKILVDEETGLPLIYETDRAIQKTQAVSKNSGSIRSN